MGTGSVVERSLSIQSIMLVVLGSLCLALAAALPSDTRSTHLHSCTNHPEGFCIDQTQFECPAGWMWSYSGCGFLEKCCYPQAGAAHTTAAPAGGHVSASSCGISSVQPGLNKIVGGEATTIEAHPWQISLRENGYHICGGTLVAANWVMTAAHCVEDVHNSRSITILAGSTSSTHYSRSQVHSVSRILMHAEYGNSDGHDIAMLKLSTSVDLTDPKTRAICLAEPGDSFQGKVCVASGWGYMREDAHTVTTLRHVALPVISNSLCDYYMYGVHDKIICAGQQQGGKDTCQGDSGGPLVCQSSDGSWKQAGIVSTGVGCARRNKFGFYTAVSQFNGWVKSVMSRY